MKEIDKIMDKKVFIVRNPNRRKETNQCTAKVLQIEDCLLLMRLAKQEVLDEIEHMSLDDTRLIQIDESEWKKLKSKLLGEKE